MVTAQFSTRVIDAILFAVFVCMAIGVTIAIVVIAVFPKTGYVMRPLVCDDNEIIGHVEWEDSDGTQMAYHCERNGVRHDVTWLVAICFLLIFGVSISVTIGIIWLMVSIREVSVQIKETGVLLTPE